MHSEVAQLAALADEASKLLLGCDEKHWGLWLENCARRIRNFDFSGVEGLRGAFGGMGSINDLVLHPANGHKIIDLDLSTVNERWASLRGQIGALSGKLYAEEISAQHERKMS